LFPHFPYDFLALPRTLPESAECGLPHSKVEAQKRQFEKYLPEKHLIETRS